MGFRALRVLNDDRVAAGKGFGAHGHRDMEILSYVLEGKLAHKDSMGEEHVLGPNEVQAMSAGSASSTASSTPRTPRRRTSFRSGSCRRRAASSPRISSSRTTLRETRHAAADRRTRENTTPPSAFINQDARMYAAVLGSGETISYPIAPGRHAWVQGAAGEIDVNGVAIKEGDGLAVSDEAALTLRGAGASGGELLLFDLA